MHDALPKLESLAKRWAQWGLALIPYAALVCLTAKRSSFRGLPEIVAFLGFYSFMYCISIGIPGLLVSSYRWRESRLLGRVRLERFGPALDWYRACGVLAIQAILSLFWLVLPWLWGGE